METKTLGEIATYINGYAFKPTDRGTVGLPIIRIQDLTGNEYDLAYYNGEYPSKIEINDGDILISWSGSLGVYEWNKGKALLNQHIFRVVFDKEPVEKKYFIYAIKKSLASMSAQTHGATMKHITKKDFDKVVIPFPSIVEQQTISNNLAVVEVLIENYKNQLEKLDALVKSRFVEMFGDPVINSNNLPELPMTEVCEIIDGDRGKNYPSAEEFSDKGYCLFLNAKNVTAMGFNFENCLFVSKEKDEALRKGKLSRGDVVLTTRGTVGNLAIFTNDVPFQNVRINSGMVILRMNNSLINNYFFVEQFKMQLDNIKKKVTSGSAQPQLPISTMGNIKVLLPDIDRQSAFVKTVKQIDKSKSVIQKSLYEAQVLFDSLMQQYFD